MIWGKHAHCQFLCKHCCYGYIPFQSINRCNSYCNQLSNFQKYLDHPHLVGLMNATRFFCFYPAEFTPDGVLSSLYPSVRPFVRTYVRPKFFLRFLFFWDRHVGSSWRFFHFLKKMIFWACHALFLAIFLIYKGLLGARCKSGDLFWHSVVWRFWI